MEKLVSVIVPIYQTEAYLDKCVASIVNQTYKNLEIILVDDESPDKCPQMCDQWAKTDSRIKVLHKKNGGPSAARNAALDIASGDFISFVDSDDWIAHNTFEEVVQIFETHNPDIVAFDCNRIDDAGIIYKTTENMTQTVLPGEEAVKQLLSGDISNYLCNKVYKKHVFEAIRLPEGRLWEDMALLYKLFFNAEKVYCYPKQLYFYYTRNDSLSKQITPKTLGHIFLARYERHLLVTERLPEEALQRSLPPTALSARRLYDASLWGDVDKETLALAIDFLNKNKKVILTVTDDKRYWFYYNFRWLYSTLRFIVHKIGVIIKGKK